MSIVRQRNEESDGLNFLQKLINSKSKKKVGIAKLEGDVIIDFDKKIWVMPRIRISINWNVFRYWSGK